MNLTRRLFALAFGLGLSLALAGCGPVKTSCNAASCPDGCCSTMGVCETATINHCGTIGSACVGCFAGQSCSLGTCVAVGGAGGGSGAGGGGAGVGGGSGGGGAGVGGGGSGVGGGGSGVGGGGSGVGGGSGMKPVLMFLVDKSGSMNSPTDPQASACPAGCGVTTGACPASCPTRISELRVGMNAFLGAHGTAAWTGLAIFPTKVTADACGPTVSGDVLVQLGTSSTDSPADLTSAATNVNDQIQVLAPGGGTPTGASLRFLGGYTPLTTSTRQRYVVLLTDGLPNCNAANPNTCSNGSPAGSACNCTIAACTPSSFCAEGCLDAESSAAAVTELSGKGVKTIVIGFGADTTNGDAPATLNAMASAGGFPRSCPNHTAAECGTGNTCDTATGVCSKRYFQATNGADLAQVLAQIASQL